MTIPKGLKDTFWVLKLVFKFSPKLVIFLIILQLFNSTIPVLQNRLFSQLIDDLIKYSQTGGQIWVTTFVIYFFTRIVGGAINTISRISNRTFNFNLDNQLRKVFLDKTSSLDYQHYENQATSSLISKTNEEYRWRTSQLINDLSEMLGQVISFITVLIILIPSYWYLAIIILLSEIPSFLVDKKWTKLDWKFFNSSAEKNRIGWDLHYQLSSKNHLSELKINNAVGYLREKFNKIFDSFSQGRIKLRLDKLPYDLLTMTLSYVVITFCLLIIIKDIKTGLISVGLFTFYFNVIRQTGDFFGGIVNRYINISEQLLHVSNFKKVMELPTIVKDGNIKSGIHHTPKIEFKNVYFKYPESKKYIFKNLNLIIPPATDIAIVGQNGAGKSTLIKLICRFYDPQKGQILINGVDLKKIKLSYWYKHLSYLSQEFNIYQNLTLRENVSISQTKSMSDTKITNALIKSDAFNFVKKYKNGFDTIMSHRFGGEEPSWGQWQKIAIARIFHKNAPVMILDEPTASIDAISEFKIFSRLYKETIDNTVIIVSHRFSTVRNAQKIIVIDGGKIIEQGTHQELLKLQGLYAKSYKLQAQGYQD